MLAYRIRDWTIMPRLLCRYHACTNSYFFGFDFSNKSINSVASAAARFFECF